VLVVTLSGWLQRAEISSKFPELETRTYFQMLNDASPDGEQFLKIEERRREKPLRGRAADLQDKSRDRLEKELFSANGICCTLETAARGCLDELHFGTVIVDEATQAVGPSALSLLMSGATRVVITVNPGQLFKIVSWKTVDTISISSSA
jgi:superfamily I DNA and/or RNA helicase